MLPRTRRIEFVSESGIPESPALGLPDDDERRVLRLLPRSVTVRGVIGSVTRLNGIPCRHRHQSQFQATLASDLARQTMCSLHTSGMHRCNVKTYQGHELVIHQRYESADFTMLPAAPTTRSLRLLPR